MPRKILARCIGKVVAVQLGLLIIVSWIIGHEVP